MIGRVMGKVTGWAVINGKEVHEGEAKRGASR